MDEHRARVEQSNACGSVEVVFENIATEDQCLQTNFTLGTIYRIPINPTSDSLPRCDDVAMPKGGAIILFISLLKKDTF